MTTPRSNLGKKPKNIRSQNRKLILELYREKDLLSVSSIAHTINLSRTTVMKINESLLEDGIIIEAGKGDSTDEGGKKPAVYRFNTQNKLILTFYIEYDQVHFRLSDLSYNSLIEDSLPMPRNEKFPEIARKMKTLMETNSSAIPDGTAVLACMVAVHGNVDSNTGVCLHSTHFPSWGTFNNLHEQVATTLELDCPIYIDNWIRFKAYGESKLGPAKNHESVVLIDAGWLGVASGILLGGKIFPGNHFLSGEIGHICLNPLDTEPCACGSHGCFEQQISCERLIDRAENQVGQHASSLLGNLDHPIDLAAIFAAADREDVFARLLLDDIIQWFSLAISNIIMFFDPEIILIEGDFSTGCRYLESEINIHVKRLSLPRLSQKTTLLFNEEKSANTLKGAAVLAVDSFYHVLSVNT